MSGIFDVLRKVGPWALDQVFPIYCAGCGNPGRVLCPACLKDFPRLLPPFCPLCAQPGPAGRCRWCAEDPPAVDGIRVPFRMEGAIREAIHGFKYRGLRAAAPQLAQLLADYLESNPLPGQVLVPVPLHPQRLRRRGYNQAALLAREAGKLTGLPVDESLLSRARDTLPQVQTGGRAERAGSMTGAFTCTGDAREQRVILLDDVTTTGSTLSACAGALKEAGAVEVWGLALAKEA